MSDTPRMDSALRKAQEDYTESYLLTEGLKLERELNAAHERIKRLEEDGDEAICPIEYATRVRIWTKAKEAKL